MHHLQIYSHNHIGDNKQIVTKVEGIQRVQTTANAGEFPTTIIINT